MKQNCFPSIKRVNLPGQRLSTTSTNSDEKGMPAFLLDDPINPKTIMESIQ